MNRYGGSCTRMAWLVSLLLALSCSAAEVVRLDELDLSSMSQGYGAPQKNTSIENNPIRLGGREFERGVGSHAPSSFYIDLKGSAERFEAVVGVDDDADAVGSVIFEVWVDDRMVAHTDVMRSNGAPQNISLDLTGARYLGLFTSDGGDGMNFDHADWADAKFTLRPAATERPGPVTYQDEPAPPIASGAPAEPRINGARIVGATPGRDFIFRVPATGEGPLRYAAENLPEGLTLNPETGIITGRIAAGGESVVKLEVTGPKGAARRNLKIVAGDRKLALTPIMGWNSWYIWYMNVDDAKMRAAADAMVDLGLAAHGYNYVCIDDGWADGRNDDGTIHPNAEKFPDMKALGDYIHAKGLRFGTYTSPGPKTCGGVEGSYEHEVQDAMTYAEWGVDLLKYDWCSYGDIARDQSLEEFKKPYRVMRDALDQTGRDIVYSLCQYGMGKVWEWGPEVGANMWRTMGDIGMNEKSTGVLHFGFLHSDLASYAGPGHWNDPDMLMLGRVAVAASLTPNEAITHMTLWSMMSAPLLLTCDFAQLDPFTRDLFTNDEVIAVNQDPLGQAATRRARTGMTEVWARPLYDGTLAVALFNRGPVRMAVHAKWSDVGLKGEQPVRDLWQQKDLGSFSDTFSAEVPAHGAVLVKVGSAAETEW